jgi:hypothetical protein
VILKLLWRLFPGPRSLDERLREYKLEYLRVATEPASARVVHGVPRELTVLNERGAG